MKVLTVLGHDLKVRISPSWLDKSVCPAALKHQYIDKTPTPFSIPAERGSAAHEAIATLTSDCLRRGIQPIGLSNEDVDAAVREKTNYRVVSELQNIQQWVTLWRDRYRISKNIVGHEERMSIGDDFEDVDWEVGSYRGIVDVIDIKGTHCVITDHKSQPHVLSRDDLSKHFQLTFYVWLVSKFYPFVKTFEVRIWYLRYGFYASTPRSLEQLAEFERGLMLRIDKVMDISSWGPIPGSFCKWCDYISMCPIGKPGDDGEYSLVGETIGSDEQAARCAGELRLIEERRGKLSSALREYVKGKEDPVISISDNFSYGYIAKESVTYKPSAVIKVLVKHNVDPAEYANFSAQTMKKLLKESRKTNPKLFDDLEAASMIKISTRFEGREVK